MDLDSLLCLQLWPAPLEFFLHVSPYLSGLLIELVDLLLGGFLELVQSVLPLDDGGFQHEELQIGKGRECLVSSPASLDFDSCQDWPIWSLVFVFGVLESLVDLDPV